MRPPWPCTGPVTLMQELQRTLVSTSLGQVHVRCKAGEGRPLLMLHMSPRSSRMFEGVQRLLRRPVYAPDRLGYGLSDAPEKELMTMEDYAANVVEVVDGLGIDGPFDVLGMHTGSLEAIELAHAARSRVHRCAIVALPVFSDRERVEILQKYASMRVVPVEDGSHLVEAWRARFQFRTPPYDLVDIERRLVDYLLAPWPGQAYAGALRYDAEARVRTLPVPLVVLAPNDDIAEVTQRAKPLVPAGTIWVDLAHLNVDLFTFAAREMAGYLDRYLPAD